MTLARHCPRLPSTRSVTADHAAYSHTNNWRKAISFIGVLILALVLAYVVSGALDALR